MNKLLIVGDGGHGKSVLDCALSMGSYDEIAFLINHDEPNFFGFKFWKEESTPIDFLRSKYNNLIVAIGDNSIRIDKINYYKELDFHIETLVHPSATVSNLSRIGEGSVILAQSSVNAFSEIGVGCILNTKVNVDHDSFLDNGVHLSPGVSMGGVVNIGKKSWLGVGCSVRNRINIGENTIIGMGSVVTKNIGNNVIAYGVPCQVIRSN